MNNLLLRSISGFFFVLIVLGSVLIHPLAFTLLFLVIALACLHEFYGILVQGGDSANRVTGMILAAYVFLSLGLFAHFRAPEYRYSVLLLNIPLLGFVFVSELFSKHPRPFTRAALTLAGVIYIALPLGLLSFLYYPGLAHDSYSPVLLVSLFCLIWINDTFAYLTGILIGRHPLFLRISPGKTWEGSIGGAFFTLLAACLAASYFPVLSLMEWITFSLAVVLFGSLGDLTASMLKRSYQIKDSGRLIPGHGGLLDRFDATLGAAPVAFILLIIMRGL